MNVDKGSSGRVQRTVTLSHCPKRGRNLNMKARESTTLVLHTHEGGGEDDRQGKQWSCTVPHLHVPERHGLVCEVRPRSLIVVAGHVAYLGPFPGLQERPQGAWFCFPSV